jgi:hypothetical protein
MTILWPTSSATLANAFSATRMLLGLKQDAEAEVVAHEPDSFGFLAY